MKELNVIKVGGAILDDAAACRSFIEAFAAVPGAKVLVHGGGRTATAVAGSLGIETMMVEGRRVTDAAMLDVATMVYGGLVSKRLVASLQAKGISAVGLTGADLGCITSRKRPPVEVNGQTVDYGFAGDVESVNARVLSDLIEHGHVPVLAPLTGDGKGGLLNTNADTIASSVATALAGLYDVKLTFCFEKDGVLSEPDGPGTLIKTIKKEDFETMKASGTISGGMIPKLKNAFDAIENGVIQVVITKYSDLAGGTTIC